jgi:anti-sigma regulatory factor (Ser/Thr protein kinase)
MFEPEPASVPAARRFVRQALVDLGAEDFEYAASQVVSELAANAVIHARSTFEVGLHLAGDDLRVTVTDRSRRPLVTKSHSAEATTGRGLSLVTAIADDWGVERHDDGKTVWLLLRASQNPQTNHAKVRDSPLETLADRSGAEGSRRPDGTSALDEGSGPQLLRA